MEFCITDKTCHICSKTFSGKSQLYRHLREVHNKHEKYNSFYEKNECIFKCLEGCNISFRFNRDLQHHLNSCHNFTIRQISRQFRTFEDFYKWFTQVQENGAQYIKHSASQIKSKRITYYSCNRSGQSKIKTQDRKRQPKRCGTRKINAGCTSYIKLEESGKYCQVTFCNYHYGHKIELEHLPLPLESRAAIVDKLANGAKLLKIDLKNNDIEFEKLQRSDLLTRSDVKSLEYFCKNNEVKLSLPELISKNNNNDFETTIESEYMDIGENINIIECTPSIIAGNNLPKVIGRERIVQNKEVTKKQEKENDHRKSLKLDRSGEYVDMPENINICNLSARTKSNKPIETIEEKLKIVIKSHETEEEKEEHFYSDTENIEIHYVEDDGFEKEAVSEYIDISQNITDCNSSITTNNNKLKELNTEEQMVQYKKREGEEQKNSSNVYEDIVEDIANCDDEDLDETEEMEMVIKDGVVEEENETNCENDPENIEIHYIEETETISDTEEDVFGYYVSSMLKRIDPIERESARHQINQVLQNFINKKQRLGWCKKRHVPNI